MAQSLLSEKPNKKTEKTILNPSITECKNQENQAKHRRLPCIQVSNGGSQFSKQFNLKMNKTSWYCLKGQFIPELNNPES
jgi:hypothetical protein